MSIQNKLKKTDLNKGLTIKQLLSSPGVQQRLDELLHTRKDQFILSVLSLANTNPAIYECVPGTVFNAALKAAALDLPIDQNLGFAWIIPYNNRKKGIKEAQFQIGYKGLIQLALRTGQYKAINVTDIRDGELESYDRLTEQIVYNFITDDDQRERTPIIGYAGYLELVNGFKKTIYWPVEKIEIHAKRYSSEYRSNGTGNWKELKHEMSAKTVLKALTSKWGILSVDMRSQKAQKQVLDAIEADQAIINDDLLPENYIDNQEEVDETKEE